MTATYVHWGEAKVKLTWKADKQLPPRDRITSVHGFCFRDDQLLLVNLHHRGWDFPGGHIEDGETAEDCLNREAYEEGYVSGRLSLLGHITVDHSENPVWDKDGPYPKVGYQVFYRMNIEQLHEFMGKYESGERMFIHPGDVADYYRDWNGLYQVILDEAAGQL
ncbi:NUDIX domain-containing protein [Mangrovibacillus sp. Mu-81]|jgi:8-oxo-dGTP diphosphatase|uniref:NUDIX hydrolase n=1 Tax=Mangrovibacillus sp. Mu-81 TaxID=3121478 RepID=UPI002FE473CF